MENVKKLQYCLNCIGTRNCPLEIEISQFPDGFRPNCLTVIVAESIVSREDWLLQVTNIKDKTTLLQFTLEAP